MKGTFLSQIALDQTFFLDINYLFRSRKIRIQSKISGKNDKERVGRALNKVNSIAATKQRGILYGIFQVEISIFYTLGSY